MSRLIDIEISYKLARAIGYAAKDVITIQSINEVKVCGLWENKPETYRHWRKFDHTDPAVILPIQKHFEIDVTYYKLMKLWEAHGNPISRGDKSLECAIALCAIEMAGVK